MSNSAVELITTEEYRAERCLEVHTYVGELMADLENSPFTGRHKSTLGEHTCILELEVRASRREAAMRQIMSWEAKLHTKWDDTQFIFHAELPTSTAFRTRSLYEIPYPTNRYTRDGLFCWRYTRGMTAIRYRWPLPALSQEGLAHMHRLGIRNYKLVQTSRYSRGIQVFSEEDYALLRMSL